MIRPKLSIRIFFLQKKVSAQSPFFLKVQRETVGNSRKQLGLLFRSLITILHGSPRKAWRRNMQVPRFVFPNVLSCLQKSFSSSEIKTIVCSYGICSPSQITHSPGLSHGAQTSSKSNRLPSRKS